jgi:hypothetical protein
MPQPAFQQSAAEDELNPCGCKAISRLHGWLQLPRLQRPYRVGPFAFGRPPPGLRRSGMRTSSVPPSGLTRDEAARATAPLGRRFSASQ